MDRPKKQGVESCSKRLKSHYGMVTLIHKSFIFNLFAYEIKFRQDQILHFKLSESRSHLRYIKEQQSILACFMTSKGSQFKFDSAGSLTSKVLILLSNCGFFASHSHSARFRLYSLWLHALDWVTTGYFFWGSMLLFEWRYKVQIVARLLLFFAH